MSELAIWRGRRFGLDWTAAIGSGVIAGVVFLVLEIGLVGLTGGAVWGPPRMMAAIAMGPDVLPPPTTFAPGIVAVAMVVHFVLSVIYAAILGVIVSGWGRTPGTAAAVGVAFGLVLYLVNFYGFTTVFPWFAMARNWITILSHLVFGGVVGGTYALIAARRRQPA